MSARRIGWLLPALLAVAFAGCGGDDTEVRVFAAASLREAFEDVGRHYEAERGDAVRFNFAGSQVLRFQIAQGAGADVFASADERQMALAREAGLVGEAFVVARNRLVVVARQGVDVSAPADLARPGLRLVLAAPEAPAGAYSRWAIGRLGDDVARGALANVVSEEEDVKRVLTKVRLGEADAGIVYATDVAGEEGRGVRSFPLPAGAQPGIAYYIAPVRDGRADAARAFIDLVRGPKGRAALAARGFEPP